MGSDVRVLAGGAGDFHYALVRRITPDKIRLRGTVRTWERYAQAQAGKRVVLATPHNTLDVVATLVHAKGGWRISSFNWAFAPGSQP